MNAVLWNLRVITLKHIWIILFQNVSSSFRKEEVRSQLALQIMSFETEVGDSNSFYTVKRTHMQVSYSVQSIVDYLALPFLFWEVNCTSNPT